MYGHIFFDLPVYRVSPTQYRAEEARHLDKVFPEGTLHGDLLREQRTSAPEEYESKVHRTLWRYGPWLFNEIVGYVRLYFFGTQVRGEYYAPERRRIVRSRTRRLTFRTWKLASEVEIAEPISQETVSAAVRKYIDHCRREVPRRYVDTEAFDNIFPHIDWVSLFNARR